MKHCCYCTVGSRALREYVEKMNRPVEILTSPIINHDITKKEKNAILHIGWIGDYGENKSYTSPFSHKVSLNEIFFPALKELTFRVKLTLLGVRNPKDKEEITRCFSGFDHIEFEIPMDLDWQNEKEVYCRVRDLSLIHI